MRVHWLQHVPYEGLGSIEDWLERHEALVTCTRLHEGQALPALEVVDWVIVMGGPMGANDERGFPWLKAEKEFLRDAMGAGRVVIGIGLGAQLIAAAVGARVYANPECEIGWFPVEGEATPPPADDPLTAFPAVSLVFHWHSDTFELPPGARHIASSLACRNQAFRLGPRVLGLQFHPEMTPLGAAALIAESGPLPEGEFVQRPGEMLADPARFDAANALMDHWLDRPASVYS